MQIECWILFIPILLALAACERVRVPVDLSAHLPEEVRWERTPLPKEQNAYWPLLEIGQEIEKLPEEQRDLVTNSSWTRQATPESDPTRVLNLDEARTLLETSDEFAARMDAALALGGFQFPQPDVKEWWLDPEDDLSAAPVEPFYAAGHLLMKMRRGRAKAFSTLGRHREAMRELLAISRHSDLVIQGDGLYIGYLHGSLGESQLLVALQETISRFSLPEEDLLYLLEQLPEHELIDTALIRAHLVELNEFLLPTLEQLTLEQLMSIMPESDLLPRRHRNMLDRAETVRLAGLRTLSLIETEKTPWPQRPETPIKHPELKEAISELPQVPPEVESGERGLTPAEERAQRAKLRRIENPLGKQIVASPISADMTETSLHRRTRRSATRTIIALEIYRQRHGRLPATLESLVDAGIVKKLPLDPASLESLRYDRERKLLWGIGPDRVDDGGDDRSEDLFAPKKDIVFHIH
jgi:hypothetical protein